MTEAQLFESAPCVFCRGESFKELIPASYPPGLNRLELLSIYKSSSETKLLDRLVFCEKCSLVQLSPRVHQSIILDSYENAVDPTFIEQDKMRILTFSRSLKKILKFLNISQTKGLKVLDVGCAGGAFPKAAHDLGLEVIGVEPSRWLCEEGKRRYGLDLRPGTLEMQKFADSTFDLVTLWDVIEHLTDPQKTLSEIRRILKPGGKLVVNFPDFGSWQAKLMGKNWPFLLSVHLIYFTPKTISNFLNQSNFKVLKMGSHWQVLELGYVFKRASSYFKIFEWGYKLVSALGLAKIPIAYNIGQTQVITQVKKN